MVILIIVKCYENEFLGTHGSENIDIGLWVVTPCGLEGTCQRFGEAYSLHLRGSVSSKCIYLQVHKRCNPEDLR
jgi:hypothetical protein